VTAYLAMLLILFICTFLMKEAWKPGLRLTTAARFHASTGKSLIMTSVSWHEIMRLFGMNKNMLFPSKTLETISRKMLNVFHVYTDNMVIDGKISIYFDIDHDNMEFLTPKKIFS